MKVLSPFGPKIAIIKIPKNIVNKINQEVDKILGDKKKLKKSDYSKKLVGQVKQEIKLDNKFVKNNILKFITINIKKYIKIGTNRNVKKISLKSLWVVRQFKNEYNPIHFHSGNISGVGYLKIPKNINKSRKRLKTNGTIDFINGTKTFLSNSLFNHNPKVGDMILFPNNLMHTAYPFKREGERRSFSFNIDIDKKTFDIFNG
ncbi:MAG: hypothetical protein CNB62_01315 [Pelagibacterales bacterium MED-G44]|nr:MAG: hypothetical protein CNB62_01315 [Pelagibacterales bacterium MED-G44]|tara:strand:+ start:95 stop:703 length:609 start_codon:yes stop_codon:yes gene_type:complete